MMVLYRFNYKKRDVPPHAFLRTNVIDPMEHDHSDWFHLFVDVVCREA